jgi:hypothetical protein
MLRYSILHSLSVTMLVVAGYDTTDSLLILCSSTIIEMLTRSVGAAGIA